MNKVPHIVRKDWQLLWPLGCGCAVLQAVLAFLEYRPESFSAGSGSNAAAIVLSLSIGIALALTMLLVVQQDALPGVNQDWLVRPIQRRDLLVAKIVFVLLVVHGPIMVVHCVRGMAEGLSLGAMLRASLLSNLELALLFSLPVLAVGALTKTVTEALVTSLAALLFTLLSAIIVATLIMIGSHEFHLGGPIDDSGIDWIVDSLRHGVLILTAVVILGLQYFRRDTRRSRIVLGIGLLLFVIVARLPWRPAFALQEALSAEPEAGHAVTLSFTPGAVGPPRALAPQVADARARQRPVPSGQQRLSLGIEAGGLPPGAILHADRVALRIVDDAGDTVYRGTVQDWDLRSADGTTAVRQVIDLPKKVYARAVDRRLNVELDYSLTLLTPRVLPGLPALDGNASLDGIGRCVSRLDDDGSGFVVGCDAAGELPPCLSLSLTQGDSARAGPETFVCDLDYAPAAWRFGMEPIDRFVRKLPLEHGATAATGGSDSVTANGDAIVFRVYDAVAHFSRRVSIADAHLRDFTDVTPRP
jgi:hypothetical protein